MYYACVSYETLLNFLVLTTKLDYRRHIGKGGHEFENSRKSREIFNTNICSLEITEVFIRSTIGSSIILDIQPDHLRYLPHSEELMLYVVLLLNFLFTFAINVS